MPKLRDSSGIEHRKKIRRIQKTGVTADNKIYVIPGGAGITSGHNWRIATKDRRTDGKT